MELHHRPTITTQVIQRRTLTVFPQVKVGRPVPDETGWALGVIDCPSLATSALLVSGNEHWIRKREEAGKVDSVVPRIIDPIR